MPDEKEQIRELLAAWMRATAAGQLDLAYCWNRLSVTVTPLPSGAPMRRSGYTLSVLRKKADGRWVLFRDANLLTTDSGKVA